MKIFQILKDFILEKEPKEGRITKIDIENPVVELKKEEEIAWESDAIEPISNEGVIDADEKTSLAKYKSNLRLLVKQAKEKGYVDEFRLIREDDFFPQDLKWRVASYQTEREYAKSKLAYSMRLAKARAALKEKKNAQKEEKNKTRRTLFGERKETPYSFDIPFFQDELEEEMKKVEEDFGRLYEPVHFRSTKHFTINTPLSFTGSYNNVASNRKFIVIDTPENFVKSGYGYSADYQDAYLDITHEPLEISKDAIILIHAEDYDEILKNEGVRKDLEKRKVIRFKGDEALAINMVLTEEGILPYRAGRVMEYDAQLDEIMKKSMQNFCNATNLDYAQGHGNINGRGGHFTDRLDRENEERRYFEEEMMNFLEENFPLTEEEGRTFLSEPEKIIEKYGYETVEKIIKDYNEFAHEKLKKDRRNYDNEKGKITPSQHELFVSTIQLIREYEKEHENISLSYSTDLELKEVIKIFYHATSIYEQLSAAREIKSRLTIILKKEENIGMHI